MQRLHQASVWSTSTETAPRQTNSHCTHDPTHRLTRVLDRQRERVRAVPRQLAGLLGMDVLTTPWTLVADEAAFTNAGDYVAVALGDAPVVVVRGDDGVLRAFHNICRHRGMQMLDGTGNCER